MKPVLYSDYNHCSASASANFSENYAEGLRVCDSSAEPETEIDIMEVVRKIVEETGINIFLTGKAGTGKTTFLRNLVRTSHKRIVVLAPTGVAAINAGGSTIHSFFQLDFAPYIPGSSGASDSSRRFTKQKLSVIRSMDLLVIDEISMVRPDVLDAVDAVLRRLRNPLLPFGGVQLLLIGDLRQLAPVAIEREWELLRDYYASPYFFESNALLEAGFAMIELTKVYRQSDSSFVDILNRIRENKADASTLAELNRRADPALMPKDSDDSGFIRLTTHNYRADAINSRRLNALDAQVVTFNAIVKGDFPKSAFPAEETLTLKVGAQVIFIKNDLSGNAAYYNGLIGTVVGLSHDKVIVRPRPSSESGLQGADIEVGMLNWDNINYELQENGDLKEQIAGTFTQIPLRLAWAITIHKSQGLTFDKAIVDAADSFAPGQTYVALSRCRSLEGLVLDSPLPASAIITDKAINGFVSSHSSLLPSRNQLDKLKRAYYFDLLLQLFAFRALDNAFDSYYRVCAGALPRLFPRFMEAVDSARLTLNTKIMEVEVRMLEFLRQGKSLTSNEENATIMAEVDKKVKNGSEYFALHLTRISDIVRGTPATIDNKVHAQRLKNTTAQLSEILNLKIRLFNHFADNDFEPSEYLKVKSVEIARNVIASNKNKKRTRRRQVNVIDGKEESNLQQGKNSGYTANHSGDIINPGLYVKLTEWRKERARTLKIPEYRILTNKSLMGICARLPENSYQMLDITGLSKRKISQFGTELLDIISSYKNTLN